MADLPAITLWQPWATLIGIGVKQYETRSWPPPRKYIGHRIAIHAAARKPPADVDSEVVREIEAVLRLHRQPEAMKLPRGAVICTAVLAGAYRVADCFWDDVTGANAMFDLDATLPGSPFAAGADIDLFGNYEPGRWLWLLRDPVLLPVPAPAKGKQGWWRWDGVLSWRPCTAAHCNDGQVDLHRDTRGHIDFLDGAPSGVFDDCEYCHGTGLEPDEVIAEADHA